MPHTVISRPKVDFDIDVTTGSSRSSTNSQQPSRSSVVMSRFHLARQQQQHPRLVIFGMTLLFSILINNPNVCHQVDSLSIASTPSTKRPTTNFPTRYDTTTTFHSVQHLGKLPFSTVLFQSNSDANENDSSEAPAANHSGAMDDDSATTTAAATPIIDRTSFDDAGRSLLDEQDMKRMNEMGDFDVNPNVCISILFLGFDVKSNLGN